PRDTNLFGRACNTELNDLTCSNAATGFAVQHPHLPGNGTYEWGSLCETRRRGVSRCPANVEPAAGVELNVAVRGHVRGEKRCQAATVGLTEDVGPLRLGEDVLDHQGVYQAEARLQDLQAEHGQFL